TERDLRELGFGADISIIPICVESHLSLITRKEPGRTFLYVGRLAPSKRVDHIIRAFARFRGTTHDGTLWLVGSGSKPYYRSLKRLAQRLDVQGDVVFWGRTTDADKNRLLAEANVLLITSVREGWGLVVTEANSFGTPAIGYDVPGLRDSIRNLETGVLVKPTP